MMLKRSDGDLAAMRIGKTHLRNNTGLVAKRMIKGLAERMLAADPSAKFLFEFWDGDRIGSDAHPTVKVHIKTKESAQTIINKGFLGFGEAYMFDDIVVNGDLQELLRLGLAIGFDNEPSTFQRVMHFLHNLRTRSTERRARRNIAIHYDRGDELYATYLDKTMAYSCAYFEKEGDSLEQAQLNKYDHIGRKLDLNPGETLVDIGCGWGGMLIHAAQKFGIKGVGITISNNQFEFANRKIKALGLEDRVKILLTDYRRFNGKFDKFVSIGMFEHVGKEFIPVFMKKARELLKKGGLGILHTIGKEVDGITDPWTLKYIFPGGYLPNISEITGEMGKIGLSVLDLENLRMHYAMTLDRWTESFEKNTSKIREMFDEAFVRMWRLYLVASSANFKYGTSRLYQILFSNGLNNSLPLTRKQWYVRDGESAIESG